MKLSSLNFGLVNILGPVCIILPKKLLQLSMLELQARQVIFLVSRKQAIRIIFGAVHIRFDRLAQLLKLLMDLEELLV